MAAHVEMFFKSYFRIVFIYFFGLSTTIQLGSWFRQSLFILHQKQKVWFRSEFFTWFCDIKLQDWVWKKMSSMLVDLDRHQTVKTVFKLKFSFISSSSKKNLKFLFPFECLFGVDAIPRLSVGQSLQNCCCYRRSFIPSFLRFFILFQTFLSLYGC